VGDWTNWTNWTNWTDWANWANWGLTLAITLFFYLARSAFTSYSRPSGALLLTCALGCCCVKLSESVVLVTIELCSCEYC
jgi:hypothetical protein